MLLMLLWSVFLLSLSTSLLSVPPQLARFASPTRFLLSLSLFLLFSISCASVSLPLFSAQRGRGGWTCVFLIGLPDKKLVVSCVLWGLRVGSDFRGSLRAEAPPVCISEDV